MIDFRKLNKATKKDHYPLPFIGQMLERLSKDTHFSFYTVILVSLKYLCQKRIKKRPLFLALSVPLLMDLCLLVYAMHLLPFKDV